MNKAEVIILLKSKLGFSDKAVKKLSIFHYHLLKYNAKYNLISKKSEKEVWKRHILDSAQLVKFIRPSEASSISDLGSGAGFPGLILAIYFQKYKFHVKLVEKSPVKRSFLKEVCKKLDLKVKIMENVYYQDVSANIIVSRAFKKLSEMHKISREIIKKPHNLIILKGKDAQAEINNLSLEKNYSYRLESSMTDAKSKIIIFQVKK